MTHTKTFFATSCCLLLLAGNGAVAEGTASGDEIKQLLDGNTIVTTNGDKVFSEFYAPDGTIHGDGYKAKWEIRGDLGCMDYGEGFSCWSATIDGRANIWYKDGKETATGAGMMVPGNPKKH